MNKPVKRNENPPIVKTSQQITTTQVYSGPIPHPEDLKKYEEISPGFAERLMVMAEKEQEARHELSRQAIETERMLGIGEQRTIRRGQYFGMGAVLLILSLCAYGFYLGSPKAASAIACVSLASVAGAFIFKKRSLKHTKQDRHKEEGD